jgi:hypothetical protein
VKRKIANLLYLFILFTKIKKSAFLFQLNFYLCRIATVFCYSSTIWGGRTDHNKSTNRDYFLGPSKFFNHKRSAYIRIWQYNILFNSDMGVVYQINTRAYQTADKSSFMHRLVGWTFVRMLTELYKTSILTLLWCLIKYKKIFLLEKK